MHYFVGIFFFFICAVAAAFSSSGVYCYCFFFLFVGRLNSLIIWSLDNLNLERRFLWASLSVCGCIWEVLVMSCLGSWVITGWLRAFVVVTSLSWDLSHISFGKRSILWMRIVVIFLLRSRVVLGDFSLRICGVLESDMCDSTLSCILAYTFDPAVVLFQVISLSCFSNTGLPSLFFPNSWQYFSIPSRLLNLLCAIPPTSSATIMVLSIVWFCGLVCSQICGDGSSDRLPSFKDCCWILVLFSVYLVLV